MTMHRMEDTWIETTLTGGFVAMIRIRDISRIEKSYEETIIQLTNGTTLRAATGYEDFCRRIGLGEAEGE